MRSLVLKLKSLSLFAEVLRPICKDEHDLLESSMIRGPHSYLSRQPSSGAYLVDLPGQIHPNDYGGRIFE